MAADAGADPTGPNAAWLIKGSSLDNENLDISLDAETPAFTGDTKALEGFACDKEAGTLTLTVDEVVYYIDGVDEAGVIHLSTDPAAAFTVEIASYGADTQEETGGDADGTVITKQPDVIHYVNVGDDVSDIEAAVAAALPESGTEAADLYCRWYGKGEPAGGIRGILVQPGGIFAKKRGFRQ